MDGVFPGEEPDLDRGGVLLLPAGTPSSPPTLYRLSHEGFVFENFYTPLWGVSTLDGEYVTTTGLIPQGGGLELPAVGENYMPFAFGNQFSALGYRTLAFHNNTYTYYGRDQIYPNLGYEYYGLGSGLEVERTWPESDVEMMELSVPRYIQEDHFMFYYLTVSGHLNYNIDQKRHGPQALEAVEELPYTLDRVFIWHARWNWIRLLRA